MPNTLNPKNIKKPASDKEILKNFCCEMEWKLLGFPDETNRITEDVDCLAEKDGVKYCIEHTSFDALSEQRRKDSFFRQVIKGIEEKYNNLNYRLNIFIKWDSIETGAKNSFSDINSSITKWIDEECPPIETCTTYPSKTHLIKNYNNLPFNFSISKQVGGLRNEVLITRTIDDKNEKEFSDSFLDKGTINTQLKKKIEKLNLKEYKDYKKILILESVDIALMNCQKLKIEIDKYFFQKEVNVDQIWYCDSTMHEAIFTHLL